MLDRRQRLRGQTVSRQDFDVHSTCLLETDAKLAPICSWVDVTSRVTRPADQTETIRIRIRLLGQSNLDRVFVSEVRISGR